MDYKGEFDRLCGIFDGVDANRLATVRALIDNAAWTTVKLSELQQAIDAEGCAVEYQNGERQSGVSQSPNVKTHIALTKNLTTILKQLSDLAPPEKRKDTKLQAFAKVKK
ncbi:MAG: hypothetical protein FWG65_11820 [Turicibacter sp.]|nr:hypothetical protein [Turicibacter sp.]